ncbi:MAG: hypothetical protein KIT72_17935 [Polyangiaceae bacterium]|nr:hypothetical protein [Polyangiaceae bacterium]MCW5792296.1 hypothetical protein [Polyangiaceae bacterium]
MHSRRSIASFAALCLAALLACQTDPGGPELARFSVTVHDSQSQIKQECLYLPVLLGSRIEHEIRAGAGFVIQVKATRDRVELTTRGASPNVDKRLAYETLRVGYAEEFDLDVQGAPYRLNVSSSCP